MNKLAGMFLFAKSANADRTRFKAYGETAR